MNPDFPFVGVSSMMSAVGADLGYSLHISETIGRKYAYADVDTWFTDTSLDDVELKGKILFDIDDKPDRHILVDQGKALIKLRIRHASPFDLAVQISAENREELEAAKDYIQKAFPMLELPAGQEADVTFWALATNGPITWNRRLRVPSWEEIRLNYTERGGLRSNLEELFGMYEPQQGGQLILWTGSPGTGKTYAIRALAWEWRNWAELHYVIDVDQMLEERPEYLMHFLMGASSQNVWKDPKVKGDVLPQNERWRVLVFEDMSEFLSKNARVKTRQGLSRLLNLADGLIGQGLKILILVTSNEEIEALQEAVIRPGRCLSNLAFLPLTVNETKAWLEAHDQLPDGSHFDGDLAALYNQKGGGTKKLQSVGFGS